MMRRTMFICTIALLAGSAPGCSAQTPETGWDAVPVILARIVPPGFPDTTFLVTDFGAVGNGTTNCTAAFTAAIDACTAAGGGTVAVPQGQFLTGPIHLKSNVRLDVREGATILFSTEPVDYLPLVYTRWEGVELMNYSPLIYAYDQENIAITGSGVLDGQGSDQNWWSWKGSAEHSWKKGMPRQNEARARLLEMADNSVPVRERVFGDGSYLRPNFVQPYNCRNILIEGVTFRNSPMWFLHPVLSQNITVRNVRVEGLGPNNDGFDPESSKDILVENCYFNTGDDCIAIKSGRNTDGRRVNVPSENIIIRKSEMKEGHGGVVIGSEMSGGVRNVFVEDCAMDSPNLDRAIRIKTNAVRGGFVENVYVRNVTVGEVREAVLKINFYYEEGENGSFLPRVSNINLEKVTSGKSAYGIWIRGFESSRPTGITLTDCRFDNVSSGNLAEHAQSITLTSVIVNGAPISASDLTGGTSR